MHPHDRSKRCRLIQRPNERTQTLETVRGQNSVGDHVDAAYCVEKNLFEPFLLNDAAGTLVAFVATALGSGCGVGGGGLLVAGYIFAMGLSPKAAIPLSKATIFGNAVALFLFNYHRKHPGACVVSVC